MEFLSNKLQKRFRKNSSHRYDLIRGKRNSASTWAQVRKNKVCIAFLCIVCVAMKRKIKNIVCKYCDMIIEGRLK